MRCIKPNIWDCNQLKNWFWQHLLEERKQTKKKLNILPVGFVNEQGIGAAKRYADGRKEK